MIRILTALVLTALATPAFAADHTYVVTDFDRVRVEGPFEVRLTVGQGSAKASVSGDPDVIANVSVEVQGMTLVVRKGGEGWSERGTAGGAAPVITLSAPMLRGATVIGGGKLAVAGSVRSQRLDLQVTGAGSIDARGVDTDELAVTLIGTGNVALAGRSGRARLLTNGSGAIAATPLSAGDLVVRLDGPGETLASARFTADLTTTGLGRIVVAGGAKCVKHAQAGGPIECGADAAP